MSVVKVTLAEDLTDVMECMATSDNVIRAGLTPKLRDIPNLVAGLTYTAGDPKKHFVQPTPFSPSSSSNQPTYSQLYDPPIPEFAVVQVALPRGVKDAHRGVAGPSIAAVTEGSGTVSWASEGEELQEEPQSLELKMGDVLFIGADVGVSFESGKEGLTLYRAFVEA
jgi:mannose-6-phosphate isomerase